MIAHLVENEICNEKYLEARNWALGCVYLSNSAISRGDRIRLTNRSPNRFHVRAILESWTRSVPIPTIIANYKIVDENRKKLVSTNIQTIQTMQRSSLSPCNTRLTTAAAPYTALSTPDRTDRAWCSTPSTHHLHLSTIISTISSSVMKLIPKLSYWSSGPFL